MFGLQTLVHLWRFHPIVNTVPRWEPNRLKTRDMRLNTKSSRAMFLLLCSFYLNSYISVRTSFLYYWIKLVYSSSWVKDFSNLFVFAKNKTTFGVGTCISCVNTYTFKWWNVHQLWCILLKPRWICPLDLINSVRYRRFGMYLFSPLSNLPFLLRSLTVSSIVSQNIHRLYKVFL